MKLKGVLFLTVSALVMQASAAATIAQQQPQQGLRVIHRVDPVYPDEAEQAGIEGNVVLDVTVEQNGDVSSAKVLKGHKLLQKAAVDAVMQWRFSNSLNDRVTIQLTLAFKLNADSTEPTQDNVPALESTRKVNAVYPEDARRQKIQGEVPVEITVNTNGEVTDARAVGGNELLRKAAVDAARQCQFKNNRHATVTATLTFKFVL